MPQKYQLINSISSCCSLVALPVETFAQGFSEDLCYSLKLTHVSTTVPGYHGCCPIPSPTGWDQAPFDLSSLALPFVASLGMLCNMSATNILWARGQKEIYLYRSIEVRPAPSPFSLEVSSVMRGTRWGTRGRLLSQQSPWGAAQSQGLFSQSPQCQAWNNYPERGVGRPGSRRPRSIGPKTLSPLGFPPKPLGLGVPRHFTKYQEKTKVFVECCSRSYIYSIWNPILSILSF